MPCMSPRAADDMAWQQPINVVLHELNNVLSAILGYAEIVQADADAGHVDERDARQILAATRRAIELADELAARITSEPGGSSSGAETGSEPGGAA
jgi:signal transduction histidine kinase